MSTASGIAYIACIARRYDGPFKLVPIEKNSYYALNFSKNSYCALNFSWAVIDTSIPGRVCPGTGYALWVGSSKEEGQKFCDAISFECAKRLMAQGTAAEGL